MELILAMLSKELMLLKKIHDGSDATCFAAILQAWDLTTANPEMLKYAPDMVNSSMYDRLFPFPEFYEHCEKIIQESKEDVYFSVNSFYRRKKKSHDVRHLNCFVLDFDYYKIEKFQELSAMQFYKKIKKKLKLDPTAVIDSGRGIYVLYCFKNCSYHMRKLYQQIYRQMLIRYERYGMDANATHITQVIRLPGSINTKSLETVEILEFNDTAYTIQEFADLFLPLELEEVRKYQKKEKKKIVKTINYAYRDPIFKSLHTDLKKLIVLRNRSGMYAGYREVLIYLCREYATWAGCSIDESVKIAQKLNQEFHDPLTDQEIEKQCRPSNYRRRTSIDRIIDKLNITLQEQEQLGYLKRKNIKRSIAARKKRRNKLTNMTAKQAAILRRRTAVIELKRQGYRNKNIAEKLDIDKGTVSKDLFYIKKNPAKFIYKLKDYMQQAAQQLQDVKYLRITQYDKVKQLSDWLEQAPTALDFLVRNLGVAKN